jgi:hypothetical protein
VSCAEGGPRSGIFVIAGLIECGGTMDSSGSGVAEAGFCGFDLAGHSAEC